MPPGDHQTRGKRRQRVCALLRRRLRRRKLDRPLETAEPGLVLAALVEVFGQVHLEERRTVRIVDPDELDRLTRELHCAWSFTDLTGELRCPGAQIGEVEPGQADGVRHRVPERERPLDM